MSRLRRMFVPVPANAAALAFDGRRGWHLILPPPPLWLLEQEELLEADEERLRARSALALVPPLAAVRTWCRPGQGPVPAGARARQPAARIAGPAHGPTPARHLTGEALGGALVRCVSSAASGPLRRELAQVVGREAVLPEPLHQHVRLQQGVPEAVPPHPGLAFTDQYLRARL